MTDAAAADAPSPDERSTRPAGGEIWRKLLHALPGLLPFVLQPLHPPRPLDAFSQTVVIAICVVLTGVFLALQHVVRRPGERDLLSTTLSYPATVIATLLLFPAHVEFVGVVVAVLAFGDTAAYVGGKTFGRTKLPWNPDKTWVGTASFVLVSGPLASLAYAALAPESASWRLAAACGAAASLTGAVAESLPVRITDNLRVGVAAAVGVVLAHAALAPVAFG